MFLWIKIECVVLLGRCDSVLLPKKGITDINNDIHEGYRPWASGDVMLPLRKSVHAESQGDLSVSVRVTDGIKTPGSWLHPHLCITSCITFPPLPFSFYLFFCLSPVLFCFFTLPSPWCPLVISTWNFPSCLIFQSQSEHLLQDCTSPKFPPALRPAPSAAVISISSCHVVSSCQSRASLP